VSLSARTIAKAERPGVAQRLLDAVTGLTDRYAHGLGAFLIAAFIALVCIASAKFPHANWDLLPYVAASTEHKVSEPAELQAVAYKVVKDAVEPADYERLVSGDPYRVRQATDANAFASMLPMYRVKTLYISLISSLSPRAGEVGAIRLISLLSSLATGLCVGLWLYREKALALAPVAVGALMIAGYAEAARLGSPDALFMALFTFGIYALYRKREAVAALALFLSFMVRSDTIVFLVILTVLFAAFRIVSLGTFAATLAAATAYAFLSNGAGHPGWWTHFWFSNVEQQLTMQGFDPAFSFGIYSKALASGAVRVVTEQAWPGLLIVLAAAWLFAHRALGKLADPETLIFLALVLGIIARFILFPLPDVRIHGAYLLAAAMLLLPSVRILLGVWAKPKSAVS
jgi:hypothetical protein